MNEVFVDTSYWLAALNPQDTFHLQAMQLPRPSRMVTTRAVQLEVMDALSLPRRRAIAVQFWQDANKDPSLIIVAIDDSLLFRAVALFQSRVDKAWSLTDCISFVVMRERKITSALAHDHHFEQAGFQCLLKGP